MYNRWFTVYKRWFTVYNGARNQLKPTGNKIPKCSTKTYEDPQTEASHTQTFKNIFWTWSSSATNFTAINVFFYFFQVYGSVTFVKHTHTHKHTEVLTATEVGSEAKSSCGWYLCGATSTWGWGVGWRSATKRGEWRARGENKRELSTYWPWCVVTVWSVAETKTVLRHISSRSKAQDTQPQSGTLNNITLHNKKCCHNTLFIHRN